MTITRHPTGQDLMCLVCGKQAQDIDHVVNRGSGGSKERDVPENKVPLCRECHELKTVGRIETRIRTGEFDDYRWFTYSWNRTGSSVEITVAVEVSERYKCLVLSAAAGAAKSGSIIESGRGDEGEADPTLPRGSEGDVKPESVAAHTSAAAPSAGEKEEGDGDSHNHAPVDSPDGGVQRLEASNPVPDVGSASTGGNRGGTPLLTHEQREEITQRIREMEWNRQWLAGDTAIKWLAELGESAEQYISDFGYQPETMSNIIRVCEAIPPPYRNGNLRFGHHVVVYDENLEDIEMHLAECEEKGWSVAEFRRQVKGTKPRVKRWSREQIEEYRMHHTNHEACHRSVSTPCPYCPVVDELIRWLGEQQ